MSAGATNDEAILARQRARHGTDEGVQDELSTYGRPMHMAAKPEAPIHAPRGNVRTARSWDAEAAKRMLMNNLDPAVAVDWEQLVVYGGSGRAARNWREYLAVIVATLKIGSRTDETHAACSRARPSVYAGAYARRRAARADRQLAPRAEAGPTAGARFDAHEARRASRCTAR
jgi:hypothetical protein